MSGPFIQGLTEEMAHHANQTSQYAQLLGDNVRRSEAATLDLGAAMRGEAYQANVQGHDNWSQSAGLKGQMQAEIQADGTAQIGGHYGQLSMNNVQSLNAAQPTA